MHEGDGMNQSRNTERTGTGRLILTQITARLELKEVHHRGEGRATPSGDNKMQLSALLTALSHSALFGVSV